MKAKAAIFCESEATFSSVYGKGRREKLEGMADVYPEVLTTANLSVHLPSLEDTEVVFSTWGMFVPTGEQFARLPALSSVFYAAGSVKGFALPFLERGINVSSAWMANAVPVAEFVLAQILLAGKGFYRNTRECRTPALMRSGSVFRGVGNFGETVALIGFGMVARKVHELLKPFTLKVLVVDPYLSDEEAHEFGVCKTTLEDVFRQAYIVSNHLPNLPTLSGVLNESHFESMRQGATFINTGRGRQVDEPGLISVLRTRPDLTALLDVTDPEPPEESSPLYMLPNVQLSSHIAGSLGDEVVRMADYMIEEFVRWQQGSPLQWAVTSEMLTRMA